MDQAMQHRTPTLMFNDRFEGGWEHVPFTIPHPLQIPSWLRDSYALVLLQSGPAEGLLHSAVRTGSFLTMDHLKKIHVHLRYPMVSKPRGHGKDGNVVKRDWCQGLVDHLFPDATKEDKWRMVVGMMGRSWKHLNSGGTTSTAKHSRDIIKCFDHMDRQDQSEYVELCAVARDEEILAQKRAHKPREIISSMAERKHSTPSGLKGIIPTRARISRHPGMKRYQVFYAGLEKGT